MKLHDIFTELDLMTLNYLIQFKIEHGNEFYESNKPNYDGDELVAFEKEQYRFNELKTKVEKAINEY